MDRWRKLHPSQQAFVGALLAAALVLALVILLAPPVDSRRSVGLWLLVVALALAVVIVLVGPPRERT